LKPSRNVLLPLQSTDEHRASHQTKSQQSDMKQRTVLITGCSDGGIGASLAAEFHRQGCKVFAASRDVGKMASLAEADIERIALDVTSDASIAAALSAVHKATGGSLDVLVNNAGVNHVMPFADSAVADFRRVIDTNVVGVFAVTHAFLPLLVEAGGVVASIGSINEVFCPPYQAAYNASKSAVHAMGNTLRVELAPLGVRFVTVVTGSVKTKLFDNAPSRVPDNSAYAAVAKNIQDRDFLKNAKWMDPAEFSKQVVTDLLKPKPKIVSWVGGMAGIAWVMSWFGWEGMLVSLSAHRKI
jgi:1-acylglycerone phosphate reductase